LRVLFIRQHLVFWRVRGCPGLLQQAAVEEELLIVVQQGAVFVVWGPVVCVPAAGLQNAKDGRHVLGRLEWGAEVERVNVAQPVVCACQYPAKRTCTKTHCR
jgi:hypothetical protein